MGGRGGGGGGGGGGHGEAKITITVTASGSGQGSGGGGGRYGGSHGGAHRGGGRRMSNSGEDPNAKHGRIDMNDDFEFLSEAEMRRAAAEYQQILRELEVLMAERSWRWS
ncbi:hypothetical protein KSP39_PZI001518 [Platanthera zijinensis]|uniref:Uncharacterized protein n=1 Tax=Platanthera zijinensis TaxID=2320716 RepID=A0AAP0C2N1_9ASPA